MCTHLDENRKRVNNYYKKKRKSVCVLRINKGFKANLRQSTENTGELLPPVLCDPNKPTHIRHE